MPGWHVFLPVPQVVRGDGAGHRELVPPRPDVTSDRARETWELEVEVARTNTADRALDATSPFPGADVTLRWILIHMTAEYARHIGHADLIRERIDGATGH